MSVFNVEMVQETTIRGCTETLVPTISPSVFVLGTRIPCGEVDGSFVNAGLLHIHR